MKNIIITILLFLLFIKSVGATDIMINKIQRIGTFSWSQLLVEGGLDTTKVTTSEGTYRIFTVVSSNGVGITAIKVK